MKQFSSLFLLTFFCILLQAQPNRLKVYIGMLDGQKLEGYVETKKWKPWSRTIPFNDLYSDEKASLGIDSIAFMHVGEEGNKEVYITYWGAINEIAASTTKKEEEPLWLKELVRGDVRLYVKPGPEEEKDYFISGKDKEEEMAAFRYSDIKAGEKRAVYRQYRHYLKELLEDCEDAAARISRFGVDPEKLEKLIIAYNACENGESDYIAIPPASSLQIDVIGGQAFTRVSRTEDQLIGLSSAVSVPRIGGAFILYTPRSLYREAWMAELLYSPFRTLDQQGEIDVSIDYLQLNLLYKNSWIARRSLPYLVVGLKYQTILDEQRLNGLPEQVLIEHMPGFVLGFGVDSGPIGLGLRYEIDNFGLLFPQSPNYFANSLTLLLSYKLYH